MVKMTFTFDAETAATLRRTAASAAKKRSGVADQIAERGLISIVHFVWMADGDFQIAQKAVLDGVDPTMHADSLLPLPRVADNTRLSDVDSLLDHVQFAQPIPLKDLSQFAQLNCVFVTNTLDVF